MSFTKRIIRVTFTLGAGSFGASGKDSYVVQGLRASATITKSGEIAAEASLRISGMPLDVMNQLTILGPLVFSNASNLITIEAGTEAAGLGVVYQGGICEAWIDARGMPDVAFIVTARSRPQDALEPVPPTSFKGTIDVGLAMGSLATQLRLPFLNSGVVGVISDPYLHGTLRSQVRQLAQAVRCNWTIETDGLHIWPIDGVRDGEAVLIAADTGMVGYPLRTQAGFSVQTLFNPSVSYGGTILVESDITQANGKWAVYSITHDLEAEVPGGKWFTNIDCNLFGKMGP